ncbi:MAG: hypothetical protein CMH83_11685 [Nocardioides sp.]|nr:hypothetical protein [Nocardioides sp.]
MPTRLTGAAYVVLGGAGLYAALALAIDKVKLLEDPTFVPGCNLNPVLSCGSVMETDQASVFGFPNPFLGLIGFGAVVAYGLLVVTGARVTNAARWGMAVGTVAGAVMVHWLAYQSMFVIGALCPWCLLVWTVTLPLTLWSVLIAARTVPALASAAELLWDARFLLLFLWYLGFIVTALVQFWSYWQTLL